MRARLDDLEWGMRVLAPAEGYEGNVWLAATVVGFGDGESVNVRFPDTSVQVFEASELVIP